MARTAMLMMVTVICSVFNGCATNGGNRDSFGWSATLYGGVNGTDGGYSYDGVSDNTFGWHAGVSLTLFNRVPGVPAVPNFNNNRIVVNNNNTSSSNSSSNQNQSQNNNNSNSNNNSGGNGNGGNHRCGNGHGHHQNHGNCHGDGNGSGHDHHCDDD